MLVFCQRKTQKPCRNLNSSPLHWRAATFISPSFGSLFWYNLVNVFYLPFTLSINGSDNLWDKPQILLANHHFPIDLWPWLDPFWISNVFGQTQMITLTIHEPHTFFLRPESLRNLRIIGIIGDQKEMVTKIWRPYIVRNCPNDS